MSTKPAANNAQTSTINMVSMPMDPSIMNIDTSAPYSQSLSSSNINNDTKSIDKNDKNTDIEKYIENQIELKLDTFRQIFTIMQQQY
jgi:hypothetical protein